MYSALKNINTTSGDQFLFLRLFTTAQDPLPAFVGFLGFLVPLIAIALTFDSINGEFNRRTLSRVLAQPVYRDALLLGKFLGGLLTLAVVFSAIWLLIFGLGILRLGVAPSAEETGRALWFLLVTIFYGGIWMALAMLFSIIFRSPATAALASIAVWLFFTVFWGIIAGLLVQVLGPQQITGLSDYLAAGHLELFLERLSPITLYAEVGGDFFAAGCSFIGNRPADAIGWCHSGESAASRSKPAVDLAPHYRFDRCHHSALCPGIHTLPATGDSRLVQYRVLVQWNEVCRIMEAETSTLLPLSVTSNFSR